jgi:hypothetical protein
MNSSAPLTGAASIPPMSPMTSNVDPNSLSLQTSVFEILMESVLKMSNVMDLKVFVLFESIDKSRHYGGHEDLCDQFNDGILEAQKGRKSFLELRN